MTDFFKHNVIINLQILIFALYNFNSIDEIEFNVEDSDYLKDGYDLQERKELYESLKWAKKNPQYDFKGIMAEAPVPHKLKFKNKEILIYLLMWKDFFEEDELELTTDDRPPIEF